MHRGMITVTVAWAKADVQEVVPVTLPAGATAAEAVARSGLVERYRIDLATIRLAVYGRLARNATVLADGDRVEVLRPLVADPKEARRLRAKRR